jgi:hypothetical protein
MNGKAVMSFTIRSQATAGCRGKHAEVASQWAVGFIDWFRWLACQNLKALLRNHLSEAEALDKKNVRCSVPI